MPTAVQTERGASMESVNWVKPRPRQVRTGRAIESYSGGAVGYNTRSYPSNESSISAMPMRRSSRLLHGGVLFQIAFWSGPAVQACDRLIEVIARLDRAGEIELVVVDIDGSAGLSTVSEFLGGVRGAGETASVRYGSVIATSGSGSNVESFETNTILFLESA
jgi:hypothetical protein